MSGRRNEAVPFLLQCGCRSVAIVAGMWRLDYPPRADGTIELFRNDPYCARFRAQIIDIADGHVVLDRTHFFARTVDQSCDIGTIGTVHVVGTKRVDGRTLHLTESLATRGLAIGEFVDCSLDWERRYRIMRLHTAQHLLQLAVRATHDLGPSMGGWVDSRRAFLDYAPTDTDHIEIEVDALTRWVESTVGEALRTVHEFDQSLDPRRHWHIDGLGTIACDGTHVRSTAEVGPVTIFVADTGASADWGESTIRLEAHLAG